jgi:biopolymer transport protein TolQ
MYILATGNPFITAYLQSDWFGKGIFWALFILSALSWTLLAHKAWIYFEVKKLSNEFLNLFSDKEPLTLQFTKPKRSLLEVPHPFFELYKAVKQKTLQVFSRNHLYTPAQETALSDADLGLIDSSAKTTLAMQHKILEKHLFVLSTIVTLGPFLGLLGTVWGILLTFSELHVKGVSSNNSAMLDGLSMALATTVIGLVVAIPALIGYNYLKNAGKEYKRDMENFSEHLLSSLELQYRHPSDAEKISTLK